MVEVVLHRRETRRTPTEEEKMIEHGDENPELQEVLGHVREAERELGQAHHAEELAEAHLAKAAKELEQVKHEDAQESRIIVNGRGRSVPGQVVSFEEAVKLAFPTGPTKPNTKFTVTFRNAAQIPAMGELDPGQSVKVKPGHGHGEKKETVFNVTETVLS
jgi:hypothetical protein